MTRVGSARRRPPRGAGWAGRGVGRIAVPAIAAATLALVGCNAEAGEARDLRTACRSGDARACTELGYRARQGDHVLRDWRMAAELFGEACEGGDALGCVRLAGLHVHDRSEDRGVPHDSATATALLTRGCDGGEWAGCIHLARMYLEPDSIVSDTIVPTGPLRDPARAATLLERACDGADLEGCTRLGLLVAEGTGAEPDVDRAIALHQEACDGGSALGCAHLGRTLETGLAGPADPAAAASLYDRACPEEMLGCFRLAGLYERGLGVDRDLGRAEELYDDACDGTMRNDEGSPPVAESCYRLGVMHSEGIAEDPSPYWARFYYRRACTLGHADACPRAG